MISAMILGIAMVVHSSKDAKQIPPVVLPKAETSEMQKDSESSQCKQDSFSYSIPGLGISATKECKNPDQDDWTPYSKESNQENQPEVKK